MSAAHFGMGSEGLHGGHVEGGVAGELKGVWAIDPRLQESGT